MTTIVTPDNLITRFMVFGKAEPGGSKQAFVPLDRRRVSKRWPRGEPFSKNGRAVVSVVDDNTKSKDWKQAVAYAARQVYQGPLVDGPLFVRFLFLKPYLKRHFRTGKKAHLLRDDVEAGPTGKPDVLKLARSAEDALTNVIWTDDARIVDEKLHKRWSPVAGCVVEVYRADEATMPSWADDLIQQALGENQQRAAS